MSYPTLSIEEREAMLSAQIKEAQRSLYAHLLKARADDALGQIVDDEVHKETRKQITMLDTVLKVYHEEWNTLQREREGVVNESI